MRRAAVLATIAALLTAACTSTPDRPVALGRAPLPDPRLPRRTTTSPDPAPVKAAAGEAVRLRALGSCDSLLEHVRAKARRIVKPWGLPGGLRMLDELSAGTAVASGAVGAPAPVAAPAPPSHSATNVQEMDVDEPDIVKTDGARIFTIVEDELRALSVRDGEPALAGKLDVDAADAELLLAGDRVLVLRRDWGGVPAPAVWDGDEDFDIPRSTLLVVDVSDPARMRIERTIAIEGRTVSARLVGGLARVVVASDPEIEFPPQKGWSKPARRAAVERNRRVIDRAPLERFLPRVRVIDAGGDVVSSDRIDCARVYVPPVFSGIEMVSVATIDLARGTVGETAAVVGGAEEVYANERSLYVATTRWGARRPTTTLIHRFDISQASGARYASSGVVPGRILNQWSISEHDGNLRVASTTSRRSKTDNIVTVLAERAGTLLPVGSLSGLGHRGESIFGVRFIGDRAYVVTFLQIDPLHVIDLSDPKRPRLAGELEIPGYSAYLHPVGEGLLLGIGRTGGFSDEDGMQVSLFDVSDPARPRRSDRLVLTDGWSESEWDHHAFLWWADARTAVLPVSRWTGDRHVSEAVVLRVENGSIEEIGRISHRRARPRGDHEDWRLAVRRSLVIGETLFTLSGRGLLASDLATLGERAWIGWPLRPGSVSTWGGGERGHRDGDLWRARFDSPGQVATAHDGTIYVADAGNEAVRRIRNWRARTIRIGEAPTGVAVARDGTLYVATGCALLRVSDPRAKEPAIEHVTGQGSACDDAPPLGADGSRTTARFGRTAQIAVARDGAVIVADRGAHAIRRVDPETGAVTTIAGTLGKRGDRDGTDARFDRPTGVSFGADGAILVTDAGNRAIRRVEQGRVRTIARDERFGSLAGIDRDEPSGAVVAASSTGVWLLQEGGVERIGSARPGDRDGREDDARFRSPSGVLVLDDGSVVVADTGNDAMRTVSTG